MDGALDDIRILDLTSAIGMYAGKTLADLGADVIKVEPPGGDPARLRGPFYRDEPHLERSLRYFYHNTNKRGITLDLLTDEGRELFLRLAETADIIIESGKPGWMDSRGLSFESLKARNPGIILVSVTPFGQTGHHAGYKGTDIVGAAMSGLMYISGTETSPPSQPGGERGAMSEMQAAIVAACGALIALVGRGFTGEGRMVDVSMQEALSIANDNALPYLDILGEVRRRKGGVTGSNGQKNIHHSKDGWVVGQAGGRWRLFRDWLEEEGFLTERFRDDRWLDNNYRQDHIAEVETVLESILLRHTRTEIYAAAQRRRLPIAPVRTLDEIFGDVLLREREFYVDLDHPAFDQIVTVPGAPYKLAETPWRVARPAPTVGQHNAEVFAELGMAASDIDRLSAAGVV